VGARAAPTAPDGSDADTGKWMRVELAGEAIGENFERGLSQHPNINDSVHLVTENDLRRIYGHSASNDAQVSIGTLSNAENIEVRLSLDSLVTRHSAILGSTGSGKSTTVASLLRSIVQPTHKTGGSPAARILVLDIHGEYTSALGDIARIFSISPQSGEDPLFVP
jgi:uncharacterized protein